MKNGFSVSSRCFLLLVWMWIHPFWSSAFAPSVALLGSRSSAERERSRSWLPASMDKDDLLSSLTPTPKELFPTAEFLDFEMKLHRPLGCTVEESLADHPVTHVVFVSKVIQGGFADTAGLQVGDVLTDVTGIFGEMESVTGLGVDKVKELVASVPDAELLTMSVARGTQVMDQHEEALVELCTSQGTNEDKEVEASVVTYIAQGYNYQPDDNDNDNDDEMEECDADDADTKGIILDNMHLMWDMDLPSPSKTADATKRSDQKTTPNVKPWSSRSSGSGTYVRDPKTGEMRNIDLDTQ